LFAINAEALIRRRRIKMWMRWENAPKCNLCGSQEAAISSMKEKGGLI
jgi:hypothetical protein